MARLVAIQGDAVWLPMMLQCLRKACLRRHNAAWDREVAAVIQPGPEQFAGFVERYDTVVSEARLLERVSS